MYSVLIILFVVSMLLLAISIVKPNLVLFWKHHAQRQKAMKFYGILTIIFFVLLIIYAPELPDFTGEGDLDSITVAHASQKEELEEIYPLLPKRIDRFQQLINKSDTAVLHAFLEHRGYYTRKSADEIIYNWDSLSNLNARLLMDLRNRMCTGYQHQERYMKELAFDVTVMSLDNKEEQLKYVRNFLKEDLDNNRFAKFRRLNDEISEGNMNQYPAYTGFYDLLLLQINTQQLIEFFKISNYIRLEKHGGVSHYKTFPALLPDSKEVLEKWESILETTEKKPQIDRYAAMQVVQERLNSDTLR